MAWRGLAIVLTVVVAAHAVAAFNNCSDVATKRLITRLWVLQPAANFTTDQVATTFQTGFGPQAVAMPGFDVYVGSVVNTTNNFFFNIFDNETEAVNAQAAAKAFVANGVLNVQISKVLFSEGGIAFYLTADSGCLTTDLTGMHLATRLWQLTPTSDLNQFDVAYAFMNGFGPVISAQAGFRVYCGMIVNDGTGQYIFFFNVFDTAAQAATANALAAGFVANSTVLLGNIQKVAFVEASISFELMPTALMASSTGAGVLKAAGAHVTASVAALVFCAITGFLAVFF